MTPRIVAVEQAKLYKWIDFVYPKEPLSRSRKDFLQDSWRRIANLVHYNRDNELVRDAVHRYPDLIPRGFVILTILYGAYTSPPGTASILKDFVAMLGKDLTEEELSVCAYAKKVEEGSFFPELFTVMEKVRKVYGEEHFSLTVLPPTPYHAYSMYVLNHSELLEKDVGHEELFGHLSVSDSQFRKIYAFAKRPDPPETRGNQTLH